MKEIYTYVILLSYTVHILTFSSLFKKKKERKKKESRACGVFICDHPQAPFLFLRDFFAPCDLLAALTQYDHGGASYSTHHFSLSTTHTQLYTIPIRYLYIPPLTRIPIACISNSIKRKFDEIMRVVIDAIRMTVMMRSFFVLRGVRKTEKRPGLRL